MNLSRKKIRVLGSPCLLLLLIAALSFQGCAPYHSSYIEDPATRKSERRLDFAAAIEGAPVLSVTSFPTPDAPGAPLTARLVRPLTGPEADITTVTETSYKNGWSPLLIPFGALLVTTAPIVVVMAAIMGDDKMIDSITGANIKRPCQHGQFMEGLHFLVGINTSCTVVDSRTSEKKEPTGKTVTQEMPITDKPLEFRLAAQGENPIVNWYNTDSSGNVSLGLQPLFCNFRDNPTAVEVIIQTAGEDRLSKTVSIDTETSRRLFLPIAEERAGDRALADRKGFVALDHFTRAFSLVPEDGLWRKIASTYRALPVKPPVPEETRRLLVQAETLSNNNDAAGGVRKLREAIRTTPWFPVPRYNLAMAHAMEKNYSAAIGAMESYLELVPDAVDARQAKNKIYEWEVLKPAENAPGTGRGSRFRRVPSGNGGK